MKTSRKGQLSFDLAFAILTLILILGMVTSYFATAGSSTDTGRRLMTLNMVADYVAGNLNAFYNSLAVPDSAEYTIELPKEYTDLTPPSSDYSVNYNMTFFGASVIIENAPLTIRRDLNFNPNCPATTINAPGKKIRVTFNTPATYTCTIT